MNPQAERRIQIALAVAAAIALVAALVVGHQARQALAAERAGEAALRTARTSVPVILGYTDSNLANQLSTSRRLMTRAYASRYASMVKTRVWPQAKSFGVANQVVVVASGIVRSSTDSAVVLVFANQTTRTKEKPKGVTQGTRLELTLRRHGSSWLVDDMRPL